MSSRGSVDRAPEYVLQNNDICQHCLNIYKEFA